jgi:hypothetical protein
MHSHVIMIFRSFHFTILMQLSHPHHSSLHFISLHFTSLHFTSLHLDDFSHTVTSLYLFCNALETVNIIFTYWLVNIQGWLNGCDLHEFSRSYRDMCTGNTVHVQINMKCSSSSGQWLVFKKILAFKMSQSLWNRPSSCLSQLLVLLLTTDMISSVILIHGIHLIVRVGRSRDSIEMKHICFRRKPSTLLNCSEGSG